MFSLQHLDQSGPANPFGWHFVILIVCEDLAIVCNLDTFHDNDNRNHNEMLHIMS